MTTNCGFALGAFFLDFTVLISNPNSGMRIVVGRILHLLYHMQCVDLYIITRTKIYDSFRLSFKFTVSKLEGSCTMWLWRSHVNITHQIYGVSLWTFNRDHSTRIVFSAAEFVIEVIAPIKRCWDTSHLEHPPVYDLYVINIAIYLKFVPVIV